MQTKNVKRNNKAMALLLTLTPAVMGATVAVAHTAAGYTGATTDLSAMNDLLVQILGWVEGPLGTLMAIASLTVGLGMGIMQQSIAAVIIGIGFAAVVAYGPGILQGISGVAHSIL